MLELTFSSKLDWVSYIISIPKTASKKIEALIHSMKFFSLEVTLNLYKSVIKPCMKCCCHVWYVTPSRFLELLDKLQKKICKTTSPSLAASLELLVHHQNIASLSLFYRYYFGRYSSEWVQLVPLLYSVRLHYSITIPRCYKDILCQQFLFSYS